MVEGEAVVVTAGAQIPVVKGPQAAAAAHTVLVAVQVDPLARQQVEQQYPEWVMMVAEPREMEEISRMSVVVVEAGPEL